MKEATNLITATRLVGDGRERIRGDFYPTPKWAVEALLDREHFDGDCWEPACGKGDISKVLTNRGYNVYSTDILDYGYGIPDLDFLIENSLFADKHRMVDNIITNPPFNLAVDFINQSKRFANYKIAMFLKTTFLEGVERKTMWKDKQFPFKKMYQFSRRVSFGKEDKTHKAGGMMAFAWFVWERKYLGDPIIDWI